MRNIMIGMTIGLFLGATATAVAQVFVSVPTNGVLKGYIVQYQGKSICYDPEVWNEFRGPDSFIVCD